MFKANGRTGRTASASKKNKALGKEFACTKCEHRTKLTHVEFGVAVLCDKCGSNMVENYEK